MTWKWRQITPSLVTSTRILLLPLIWVLWVRGHVAASLLLYGVVILSDWADGFLARRFGTPSTFGAFFDVTADVVLLVGLLLLLGLRGVVPSWLFLAPLGAALAFFITSHRSGPQYDPLGKYFGSILFVLIGCLLWKPHPIACTVLSVLIGFLSLLAIVNRWRIRKT